MDVSALAAKADALRSLHRRGDPLVLCNAWDAATATVIEGAGYRAVATTSAAVAAALGGEDDDSIEVDDVFDVVRRIAAAVSVPVTADVEAGYRLPADELARRLLEAGAVGCNLEDSDHHGSGVLVPVDAHAERVAAVKDAARTLGVDLVLNARTDGFARGVEHALEESVTRGNAYRAAGADCVYPILAADEEDVAALVARTDAPVNVMFRRGSPSLGRLRDLGVARVSVGSGLFRRLQRTAAHVAEALLAGDGAPLLGDAGGS